MVPPPEHQLSAGAFVPKFLAALRSNLGHAGKASEPFRDFYLTTRLI
jgi:hypothetical protein